MLNNGNAYHGRTLTDLSDDDLLRVFRNLSLKDLNTINASSQRFHNLIVENNLYQNYSIFRHFDVGAMFRRYSTETTDYKMDCVRGYLRRFGHLIEEIKFEKIGSEVEHNQIFTCIIDYCTAPLTSLQMSNINLDTEVISRGQTIFSNLTKLDVDKHMNLCSLLRQCENLTDLCLRSGINYYVPFHLNYTFPNLHTFALKFSYEDCIKHDLEIPGLNNSLDYFFQQHPDLISLSLQLPHPFNIDLIAQLTNLEEIYFNGSLQYESVNLQPLWELNSVRKLEVHGFYDFGSSDFLSKSESIHTMEHLAFDLVPIDNMGFIKGLSRFRNIRYLSLSIFYCSEVPEKVWEKLGHLYELTELHLSDVDQNDDGKVCHKFLKYLTGAHESLETFSLNVGWNMSVEFVASLANFECLQKLQLEMDMDDIEQNLEPFHHLTALKELILISKQSIMNNSIQQDSLVQLSSLGALEKIEFRNFSDDGVFVRNSKTKQFEKM